MFEYKIFVEWVPVEEKSCGGEEPGRTRAGEERPATGPTPSIPGDTGRMISIELARALRDSGLPWHPTAGDAFRIDRIEADDDIYILSDMTVEAHDYPTGMVLGFNGTTEWALDSVDKSDALWMPHEHQLRALLATAFVALRAADGRWQVDAVIDGEPLTVEADAAADAYARALLRRLDSLET